MRRGFTLIEVMVVATVALGLMTTVYLFMLISMRFAKETEATANARDQAAAVVRNLNREMSTSVDSWTVFGPEPNAYVRFLSAKPPAGTPGDVELDVATARIIWKTWVCYYRESTDNTLIRAEIALNAPTSDLGDEPSPASLVAGFKASGIGKRVIAKDIEKFSINGGELATYDIVVTANTTAAVASSNKQARVTMETRIAMVNHFP